jgi:dipeptidyl aminopeptidase/acylaminoacyl peptidase
VARTKFHTRLLTRGAAPQEFEPLALPADARELPYASGDLHLTAWVSAPPTDGQRHAAVLFLHGGFAFSADDWEQAKPYRDAGYVVMMPSLRGENGQPGTFTLFFDELDDVLAAADAFVALPYVRTDRLFIAGHSVGGTLTLLAALRSSRFHAAASFSGSPDQRSFLEGQPRLAPFDMHDAEEVKIRSPLAFATDFQCPVRAYFGDKEPYFAGPTAKLVQRAQGAGLDVKGEVVPGDHMSHVAESMRRSIEFFRSRE